MGVPKLFWTCLEPAVDIALGLGALAMGNPAPLKEMGFNGLNIREAVEEARAKHGPDDQKAMDRIRAKVLAAWEAQAGVERLDTADLEAADHALKSELPRAVPEPARIAELMVDARGFQVAVTHEVLISLGKRREIFRPSGEMGASDTARRFAEVVVTAVFSAALEDKEYVAVIRPQFDQKLGQIVARIDTTTQSILDIVKQTHSAVLKTQGLEAGVTRLARSIGLAVEDPTQALAELEDQIKRLVEGQRQPQAGTNLDLLVNEALKRIAAKAAAGDFDGSFKAASDAFADWEERQQRERASGAKLAEAAMQQQLFLRNPMQAARWVERRVALEAATKIAPLDALDAEYDIWLERGRNKAIALDLEVAEALAKAVLSRPELPPQTRGYWYNALGNALWTLGERESGTARLEEAVLAYEQALEERTRERVPLQWAMVQNNLGVVLGTLAGREGGTKRLEEAVRAYGQALEEWTRERVPLDWAMVQNNLGNVLLTLGQRERRTARLEEAVLAYEQALKEWTREQVPLDWAATQNNLGNALSALGQWESGTARLQESVLACSEALKEWTRERVPLKWAKTQNNLALAEELLAYRAPGQRKAYLSAALARVLEAEAVFVEAGAEFYVQKIAGLRTRLDAALRDEE